MRLLGILLVIFGVVLLVYQGLTFIIPQNVWDLGAFAITVRENVVIPLPPVLGLICLVVGILFVMVAPSRRYDY